MNKYHVYLADNYTSPKSFMTDWDYELVGDKFRAEFDVWFKDQETKAKSGAGKTRELFKGEYIKKFMISKRINLVDDPNNGNLKSVFILKIGEKKMIDERAKINLASRFEYKDRKDSEGKKLDPLGFMKFILVEGSEKVKPEDVEPIQVEGNDIEYFSEEISEPEKVEEVKEVKEEVFVCEECGKEFITKKALQGHNLSHRK